MIEVGGDVDEVHVTLGVYGPDLDPDVISSLLGCSPTHTHRRGEPHGTVQVPLDPDLWRELASKYELRIGFGLSVYAETAQ